MSNIPTRFFCLGAGALALCAATLGVGVQPAFAADAVASYTAAGVLASDGALQVKATLKLEGSPAQVQQRFATTLDSGRDGQYRFTLSDITASVAGQGVAPQVATDGDYQVVTVPVGKPGPVELSYTVRGAAIDIGKDAGGADVTELNWRLLQGLDLPVRSFDATITLPGLFTSIDCYAGSPANPGSCAYYAGGTHDQADPAFHDEGLGAGEVVGAVIRLPSSVVKPNSELRRLWTLDSAFSTAPLPLALALGVGLLGGGAAWLLHRRFGRDAGAANPMLVGSFRPVGPGASEFVLTDDIRPGEIGTLVDERVDPIDIAAGLLDLAVRNHVTITELPRESPFKPTEWTVERRESAAALLAYERTLLDAIAPGTGEPRSLAEVAPALALALPAIQAQLYDEVVRKGWFAARPDQTRGRWSKAGWVALALAVCAAFLLIALTPFGLLALVLVALAGSVGLLGHSMPARTGLGASALAGLSVLRGALLTQPTDQMPPGREHEELAQVLPYAVVLGGADRWLDALAAVNDPDRDDATELSWYHGPQGWTLADLPDSLRNLIRAFSGMLVARG